MRRRLTYDQVAQQLGVTICDPTALCRLSPIDHERGEYRPLGNGQIIHWRDRRMTKAGLYRFLRLVAQANLPLPETPWLRTYLIHQAANDYARRLHTRIPFDLTREARARVKSAVLTVPRRTPLRREAFQWSRRLS